MDSFELNKILGAVLGTCMGVLALNITAGAIFSPEKPAKPGYEIAVPDKPGDKSTEPPKEEPIAVLLASADIKRGEASHKKCISCHTFEKGGPNRIGPNLWGTVGRPVASVSGFNYSAALKGMGGEWTFERLSEFLTSPKGMVAGTNMAFAGIPRGRERADLIAYLNAQSDNPLPLPKAAAAPAGSPKAEAPAGSPKAEAPAGTPKADAPGETKPAKPKP
jgi:cytochrome c